MLEAARDAPHRGLFKVHPLVSSMLDMGLDISLKEVLDFALDKQRLIELVLAREKKAEETPDYVDADWSAYFEPNEPPAYGWEQVAARMNLRRRFNYAPTSAELPAELKLLWSACHCWGEFGAIIAPESVQRFSERCMLLFKLMGDRLKMVPFTGPLLGALEDRSPLNGNALSDEEVVNLVEHEGYECYGLGEKAKGRMSCVARSDGFLVLHAFEAPNGLKIPGALFANKAQKWRDAGTGVAGHASQGGTLTRIYTVAKRCNLDVTPSMCLSLPDTHPVWDHLTRAFTANPHLGSPGAQFSAPGGKAVNAIVLSTDQGKHLVGGTQSLAVQLGETVVYLSTSASFMIQHNDDLMKSDDLQPDSAFGKHLHTFSLTEGYLRQHKPYDRLWQLASHRSGPASRIYALIDNLNQELEEFIQEPIKVNDRRLHPCLSGSQSHSLIENQRERLESSKSGTADGRVRAWSIKDLLKESILENAFNKLEGPTPWVVCSLVLL